MPEKEEGKWTLTNIIPLHEICHKQETVRYEIQKKVANK